MKNSLKRIIAAFLSLAVILSFAGCDLFGGNGDDKLLIEYVEENASIKNVILIIGDGMGEAQLDAGELVYGEEFAFRDDFSKFFADTNSLNSDGIADEVTDSAASATALATGILTENKNVGMDTVGNNLKTILDIAADLGKATGIVTNDYLTGATPAGFSAHTNNRNLDHEIVRSQATSGVDLLIGQYNSVYEEHLTDIEKEYKYFGSYDRDAILASESAQLLCQFEIETQAEGAVALKDAAGLAIDRLNADEDGFVLVVEQAYIDKSCHSKDFEKAAFYASSLNDTVNAALEFAKGRNDTAIIVTADHETCGLAVSTDAEAYSKAFTTESGKEISYEFTASYHTGTPVPVYVSGFTAYPERLSTFSSAEKVKNCEIFLIMKDLVYCSKIEK